MAEIDLLLKLFDTLKDAIKDIQLMCQAMLTNQNNIGNYVKSLPDALKDHAKESSDEIGTCTETVEAQSDTVLNEIRELKGKVKTMIIVVVVAFTLFTAAVMIARLTDERPNEHHQLMEKIEELEKHHK